MFRKLIFIIAIIYFGNLYATVYVEDVENFSIALKKSSIPIINLSQLITQEYLDKASPGLKSFIKLRLNDTQSFINNISNNKEFYISSISNHEINHIKTTATDCIEKFRKIYANFKEVDCYFLVGNMKTAGTTYDKQVLIAIEMFNKQNANLLDKQTTLLDLNRLPSLITHEIVHTQQIIEPIDANNYEYGILLAASLAEGTADFIAEYITGSKGTNNEVFTFGMQHEKEIWNKFKPQMYSNNLDDFLYNSNLVYSNEWHADLGYFVGYRIAQCYFNNADDKNQAIIDLIEMKNPHFILEKSNYDRFVQNL